MIKLPIILCIFTLANSLPTSLKALKGQTLVDYINSQGKWKARLNPQLDSAKFGIMQGARKDFKSKYLVKMGKYENSGDVPAEFDSRTNWPQCSEIIGNIADQSECGSCYAVSSASVMSDRLCISSGGQIKTFVSAADIMSCCQSCGFGCEGGWPDMVFGEWADNGIVSGSNYTEDEGCKPYTFPSCQHYGFFYENSSRPKCPSSYYTSPKCSRKCNPSYKINYNDDKTYGKASVPWFEDALSIQKEIMTNGPVVGVYSVYADFKFYASGIYEQLSSDLLGYHAVRIIGWGTQNGVDFWKVANSWNSDWGENGIFRIRRGTDECGIESQAVASIPDITRSAKLFVD